MKLLRCLQSLVAGLAFALLAACGGGGEEATTASGLAAPTKKPLAEAGLSLTVHYRRSDGNYDGWQIHTWNAAVDPGWNNGHAPARQDDFGAVYEVPLTAAAATGSTVGYLFHKGDTKDHGSADQSFVLKSGANYIWRLQGDSATYTSNPLAAQGPDIHTLRVHYLRPAGDFSAWGLHLWPGSGLDLARLPGGLTIDVWGNAVPFASMPGYRQAGAGEVVFDIPVLNPRDDAARLALEFVVHGRPPFQDNKDGRADNIRVVYRNLTLSAGVGEIWLVQQDARVYVTPPDTRRVSSTDARAYWLNRELLQWPGIAAGGAFKLYHSAQGHIAVRRDQRVSGADGSVPLSVYGGTLAGALAERFKFIDAGVRLALRSADQERLPELLKQQLVLVQEDTQGRVQNATTAQLPGVLDDLYAEAAAASDFGATVRRRETQFKLWAPTAQQVSVQIFDSAEGPLARSVPLAFDRRSGSWSAALPGNLQGKYYLYTVRVFARGHGVVRNLVTDPYSLSLNADSRRSFVADLASRELTPPGWHASQPPPTVRHATDVAIYELHVRDFSANDSTVSGANRGKYLAFTESSSQGMRHLRALAEAGITDIHLLPTYDLTSIPERGCATPSVSGAPDGQTQQATVSASAGTDCFNWGYDPWHYNAPEGSYASDANDGARRIVEFRRMVMALHEAGLRVGLDVVYNHTAASGQSARSVLDRIVPGYYHRLSASGGIETSTCCENTATEHLMMGKLMIDSAIVWTRDYKVSSLRFDVMGHQPRSTMEQLKAAVRAASGREIQLIGEGWNFGEVADGRRFVQASMWSLNGSGIATFSPFARDAVRGGSPFDSGNALRANQGFVNGLWYAPNEAATNRPRTDLMYQGDLIRAGLAGSIRSYVLQTHWDAVIPLEQLNTAGYVAEPSEVVNYVENHDNQTLFDINAFKLPLATSREDRARVQMLAAAVTMFSQGIAYFHAGVDTLRSKSLDRNSYDAGDWFNRLDWSYADNGFGSGLPRAGDNAENWAVMAPLLANSLIKPTATEIAWARDAFRDLMKIRRSTTLLRLRSAQDISGRLVFFNTGSAQEPTVLAAWIGGYGYEGAVFKELVYLINVDTVSRSVGHPLLRGRAFELHPVHAAAGAADTRARSASYDGAAGSFSVPPRTAVVFVVK